MESDLDIKKQTLQQKNIRWACIIRMQNTYHIKKENIGLIEVMGLCKVLPARLKGEMELEEILKAKIFQMNRLRNIQRG